MGREMIGIQNLGKEVSILNAIEKSWNVHKRNLCKKGIRY